MTANTVGDGVVIYINRKMKVDRQAVLDRYNGHCAYCGCDITLKTMQVDHKIPQAHTKYIDHRTKRTYAAFEEVYCEDNLMPSCRSCNNYKSGNSLEMFRRMIGKQIEVLRRDRPTFRLAERYGLIECKPKEIEFYFEQLRKFDLI